MSTISAGHASVRPFLVLEMLPSTVGVVRHEQHSSPFKDPYGTEQCQLFETGEEEQFSVSFLNFRFLFSFFLAFGR